MIGYFFGTATFFGGGTIASAGQIDAFLVQYDSAGNFTWARSMGGPGDDVAMDIAVGSNNNITILGSFVGTASLGAFSVESAGIQDIFLAQLNSIGAILWLKSEGGTHTEISHSVALDAEGNIYIAGDFVQQSTFGNTVLYGRGNLDLFVAKYKADGEFVWAQAITGYPPEVILNIAADRKGNAYCAGYFTAKFVIDDTTLTTKGNNDGFLLRIRD